MPDINAPGQPQVAARKPRIRALLSGSANPDEPASHTGGISPGGLVEATITNNNWYQADRFSATFALVPGQGVYDANWWSQQVDVSVILQIGFQPPGTVEGMGSVPWETVIQGAADDITVDPIHGIVKVDGRDLSYLLIEARSQEAFPNHTASQIATTLAQRHKLVPVVTETSTPVERYYAADHTVAELGGFHRHTTEWDLLVYLAQHEHFDLFVQGNELHFQPKASPSDDAWVVLYTPSGAAPSQGFNPSPRVNVEDLRLSRSLLIAKDIEVDVVSWNQQSARNYKATAKKTGGGSKGSQPQRYVYVYPNLTKAQAQVKANAILEDLTQHERVIEFRQPWILTISPRTPIRLVGTGTRWDQRYFVDSITRTINFSSGFSQTVRAKNTDTSSQVAVI